MSLREKLIEQREQHPGFISVRVLQELINPDSVVRLLSRAGCTPLSQADQGALEEALPRARKLAAVLVLAQLQDYILDILIRRRITDESLFPIGYGSATLPLDAVEMEKVRREEWAVPLVLKSRGHVELPRGAVLPYLRKERVDYGAFGIVYKVKIADGHLESDLPRMTEAFELALKEVEVEEEKKEAVMNEVIAYRQRQHPNLVPLLASYTERSSESGYETLRVSMLFPFADMDMETWLYLAKAPTHLACLSVPDRRLCLYGMAAKLVSALAALHREVGGLVASHHDLKPKNILVFGQELMIADLGMSNLAHLDRTGGSGADGARGLGTKSYRPPEYYTDENWERGENRKFGRAFDMWAMGCILIQIAVLVVWGWESLKLREFRRARETFVEQDQRKRDPAGRGLSGPDDSFVKSIPVVDEWLTLLQQRDGSALLRGFLSTAIQMLRHDPSERVYSWEAELDLHELLNPHEPRSALSSMTAVLVQQPPRNGAAGPVETPLHRAAARENYVRVAELLAAGWSANQKDKLGRTASEVAGQNGHFYLQNLLSRASSIQDSSSKVDLRDAAIAPVLHVQDQIGFQLREEAPRQCWIGLDEMPAGEREPVPNILKSTGALGRTPLHDAVLRGDMVLLRSLLDDRDAGKAVSLVDSLGRTPLHYAAKASAEATAVVLRAADDKLELLIARDQFGRIPLHWAVDAGNLDAAQVLLGFCGMWGGMRRMLEQEDQDGATPLDVAQRGGTRGVRLARVLEAAALGF